MGFPRHAALYFEKRYSRNIGLDCNSKIKSKALNGKRGRGKPALAIDSILEKPCIHLVLY